MHKKTFLRVTVLAVTLVSGFTGLHRYHAQPAAKNGDALETRYADEVKPFLEKYCHQCHGATKPKAMLDLAKDGSMAAIAKNITQWEHVLDRLSAKEMPPEDAKLQPRESERSAVIAWLRKVRDREAEKNAGDPGVVLARRLSNAEYDYTIRDLTGVDIRPTMEFPVDPANQSGFDNTGESLMMSPALLKKYLAAARHVADHVVLKPNGFVFAPFPVVAETDRDKYCVPRILDFYQRHQVDYADYFVAAWKYKHRAELAQPDACLCCISSEMELSEKYLTLVWSNLTGSDVEVGPLAAVRKMWSTLPPAKANAAREERDTELAAVRSASERMRDAVVMMRKQITPTVKKLGVNGISSGTQPFVLWRNREQARQHRQYDGDAAADFKKLGALTKSPAFAKFFEPEGDKKKLHEAMSRFCVVFPADFVVADRPPMFAPKDLGKGRPLSAGFHLMQGFFRDDEPLYDLILDDAGRKELDALWHELNFITFAPMRQYADYIFFERAEPPRFMFEAEFDFARSEDKDCTSEAKMTKLAKLYLAKAKKKGANDEAVKAIEKYFSDINADVRKIEKSRLDAEPSHLDALLKFAEGAYRRPLTKAERSDTLAFYRRLRKKDELSHEDALRDTMASVLLSPHFCYRVMSGEPSRVTGRLSPLSDYELASRLSYFLWSSMPDSELLEHAAKNSLHKPEILKAQMRRMLRDPKVRGLATEFMANWLDIRRFEEHNAVDRERFPSFTNELRAAMFEEPIQYFMDMAKRDRSVLDLLYGKDTYVNPVLAKHYGITLAPRPSSRAPGTEWIHVEDAERFGRGGLLPMSVFLTKNAPGLRTSPVKRGYWVVRRVLGEQIPPPPPTVPELPADEAKLGNLTLAQTLARHRADKACSGCHNRFDAVGLVFEYFGPIGERRTKDLGGRAVEINATFPDGVERKGLDGLKQYLKEKRQTDYVDNLCKKLFSYALTRSLTLSDRKALEAMKTRLAADNYRFGSLVETIVMSPQFLNKRGRDVEK